jgi:hypothetical protein
VLSDELVPTELAEQLLQVRQRDLLPAADGRQGDRTGMLAQGEVDHRGDGKTAFGGKTHRITPQTGVGTLLPAANGSGQTPGRRRAERLTRVICSSIAEAE